MVAHVRALSLQDPRPNGTAAAADPNAAAASHAAGVNLAPLPAQPHAHQHTARAASPAAPPVKRIGVLMVQLCSATMRHTTPLHPAVRIRVGKQVCL